MLWLWIALAVLGALLVVTIAYLIGQSNADDAKDP